MIKKTKTIPMMPALTLLLSASTPIVAVCTDEFISFSEVGRAPPRISAAVEDASSFPNPEPLVISQLRPDIALSHVGADMIWSSSIITIALG